jgi:hypothetical protein
MGKKNWITIGAAAAALGAAALLGTSAQAASASIYVQIAPPAPRVEVVPAPRRGHNWVPGHWEWRHRAYAWVPGYFIAVRPGFTYAQPQWVQSGGRWAYRAGGWVRAEPPRHVRPGHDRDRDGVPNRFDRDRDGDGVPNRFDRRPDNPNRR